MLSAPDAEVCVCDPVCVNVGGELYTTTLDTLTRCRDSMLGAMFTGRLPLLRDRSGNVFIDRDGKTFRHVLNFLRCNVLDLPRDFPELELLRREADFFQIRPLLEELERLGAEPAGRGRGRGRRGRDLAGGGGSSLLFVDVDSQERVLHFNYKRKPESYELRSCTVRVHSVRVFCTSHPVLQRLSSGFRYRAGGSWAAPPEPGRSELRLEWVPCPPELPPEQHLRHGFQELSATPRPEQPDPELISEPADFIAELLRLVLEEEFIIELVTPDATDILNCRHLRCVRY